MSEFITGSSYFAITLSLICYLLAARLQKRFPTPCSIRWWSPPL